MSLLLPLRYEKGPKMAAVTSIVSSPYSSYVALMNNDKISIVDGSKKKHSVTLNIPRDIDTDFNFRFVHWISKSVLAYGYENGRISFFDISKLYVISSVLVQKKIYYSFAAHGYLALCLQNTDISFLSPKGEVVSTLTLGMSGCFISKCEFYPPSTVICTIGDDLYISYIHKSSIDSSGSLLYKKVGTGCNSVFTFSSILKKVAYSTAEGIQVVDCDGSHNAKLFSRASNDPNVVNLTWCSSNEELIVTTDMGTFQLMFMQDSRVSNVAMDIDLKVDHASFCFSNQTMVASSADNIYFVEFAMNYADLFYTASRLFSLPKVKQILEVPDSLYPIRHAVFGKNKSELLVASRKAFAYCVDGVISEVPVNRAILSVLLMPDAICVFTKSSLSIYNLDLTSQEEIALTHPPLHVSASGKCIICSNIQQITLIVLKDGENCFVQTIRNNEPIKNVFLLEGPVIVKLAQNGKCQVATQEVVLGENISYAVSNPYVSSLFMAGQKGTLAFRKPAVFQFDSPVDFISRYNLYHLDDNTVIGTPKFAKRVYVSYFLTQDVESVSVMLSYCRKSSHFMTIVTESISIACQLSKYEVVKELVSSLDESEAVQALEAAFRIMGSAARRVLVDSDIGIVKIFPNLPFHTQMSIFVGLSPEKFVSFIKEPMIQPLVSKKEWQDVFFKEGITYGDFTRVYLTSLQIDRSFSDVIAAYKSSDAADISLKRERDRALWKSFVDEAVETEIDHVLSGTTPKTT